MITSVALNPSIDLTLFIPELIGGGTFRAENTRRDIAGKAVNTVCALKNMDIPVRLLGFDFVENGGLLKDALKEAGIPYDLVAAPGAIRTNIKIFEEKSSRITEINQRGSAVSQEAVSALLEKIIHTKTDVLTLSGSLPPGVDSGVYSEIIKRVSAPVILDADGPALYNGIKEGPFIIKPNIREMEQTFGVSLPSQGAQISVSRALLRRYDGLRAICLSLGEEGAMMIGRDDAYFSPALDIPVRGVQGAGDSMVAGLAAELYRDKNAPLDILLKAAMAAAAAKLIHEGSVVGSGEDFLAMTDKVKVLEIKST